MKPKALYYTILQYQPESLEMLHDAFDVVELPDPDADTLEILKSIDVIFAPLGFICGREKIDACPNLKAIASNTTGDPHIDTQYAESKGISVITLKREQEFLGAITPTAELAWGLLIALVRRIPWAFNSVTDGTWNRRLFPGHRMLSSMSLGIIGLGRLGTMVANYAKSFGMSPLRFYDPYKTEGFVNGVEKVETISALAVSCDVISLHAPHNQETDGMLGENFFSTVKQGSWFINTARAEIVNFNALLSALNSGRLAGAAMDVFEGEFAKGFSGSGAFRNHPLFEYARTHDNLLLTPHIGGSTLDAWTLTEQRTIKSLKDMLFGRCSPGKGR